MKSTRMIAYIISGITVGIAGFILMVRAGSVSTSTGQGLEMNVITALVLGGVPLSGGGACKNDWSFDWKLFSYFTKKRINNYWSE